VHILGHHHGPLGFLCKPNLGYDSCSRFVFHQLVDYKVANICERRNVVDGRFHLGQSCVNM
jgi:hypothetical protein